VKTTAQVVVIGGGVVGCSVLYHLTKKGWKDVMLLERDQLTSGSTWHAAGGFHTLNGDPNVAMLQSYTVSLYQELERISGQSCGMHKSPGIMLADTPERMEFLKMTVARGRYLGMDTGIISVAEAKNYFPFIEDKYFIGALLDPEVDLRMLRDPEVRDALRSGDLDADLGLIGPDLLPLSVAELDAVYRRAIRDAQLEREAALRTSRTLEYLAKRGGGSGRYSSLSPVRRADDEDDAGDDAGGTAADEVLVSLEMRDS
jgi:hypothetical protein